ncbi:protein CBFA2T3-like [Diadema antillarum]|uniref:protein CBFA2T3-like n=1 Tax=Diadema antillarum TaxID=105358 RepID=UPI003A877AF5
MLLSEATLMQSSSLLLRPVPEVTITTPMGILNDHSEAKMPESPIEQTLSKSASQPTGLAGANLVAHSRSHSTSSSTGSLVNGLHSPRSMNGTPSPPSGLGGGAVAIQGIPANQEVPAACGARQLSKLKRFLTTLQQFGSDISPEIGERVRGLVMGLVNNALTVEDFHNKLQEATNFPLRPFVIPFLKANLPLLQRELMHSARLAKLSPQQYYLQHEHQLLEAKTGAVDPSDHLIEVNENGKRKTPEERMMVRPKENGSSGGERGEGPHPKRHCGMGSPTNPSQVYPPLNHFPPGLSHHAFRMEELGSQGGRDSRDLREMREMREMRERLERERERERDRHTPHGKEAFPPFREMYSDPMLFEDRVEDDWKHVETMLQCIIGMVEKTKRALAVLHQRSIQDREELAMWARRQSSQAGGPGAAEPGSKKRSEEMMAQTLRQTEDRVTEVKRRAEEAVNEVKRQAVSELQKAVSAAERKANEMVSAERTKLERAILEARQQASEEAMVLLNHQEDSSESCWNCGRKASETCSGCNTARYCGAFCQHKDWENHHRMCSQYATSQQFPMPGRATPSQLPPPPIASDVVPSPAAPATSSSAPATVVTTASASSVVATPTSAASPAGSHHSTASNRSGSPPGTALTAVTQES